MKQLLTFAKDSAKKHFQELRKKSPIFCPAFSQEIHITREFFQHVVYRGENTRSPYEIMERILIFPFLSEIIKTGNLKETRKEEKITFLEIQKFFIFYKLSIIVIKRKNNPKYILLSCFKHKKKNSSSDKFQLTHNCV